MRNYTQQLASTTTRRTQSPQQEQEHEPRQAASQRVPSSLKGDVNIHAENSVFFLRLYGKRESSQTLLIHTFTN